MVRFNIEEPLDPIITAKMPKNIYFRALAKYLDNEQQKLYNKFKKSLELSGTNEDVAMKDFKNQAHRLKGTAGYIGAGRVHFDCFFVLEAFQNNEFSKQRALYNRLIEDMVDLHYHVSLCNRSQGDSKDLEVPSLPEFDL